MLVDWPVATSLVGRKFVDVERGAAGDRSRAAQRENYFGHFRDLRQGLRRRLVPGRLPRISAANFEAGGLGIYVKTHCATTTTRRTAIMANRRYCIPLAIFYVSRLLGLPGGSPCWRCGRSPGGALGRVWRLGRSRLGRGPRVHRGKSLRAAPVAGCQGRNSVGGSGISIPASFALCQSVQASRGAGSACAMAR